MAAAMIPTVAQLLASRDVPGAREKIGLSVKTTMIISIPCAAGLLVLARPMVGLLFVDTQAEEDLATGLLMALSFSVVFYALSTLNNQILQGLGKVNIPIVNAGIALMAQTVTAVVLLLCTDLDLYSIAVANTVYSGLMCMLNQRAVRRAVGYLLRRAFDDNFLPEVFCGRGHCGGCNCVFCAAAAAPGGHGGGAAGISQRALSGAHGEKIQADPVGDLLSPARSACRPSMGVFFMSARITAPPAVCR